MGVISYVTVHVQQQYFLHVHSRAVKLTEKLKFTFYTKIISKFELHSNLKGINLVRKKKLLASLRPQEGASSIILLNAGFFKVVLGNMSKNSYLCTFWLICGIWYIYRYFVFGLKKL